MGGGGRPRLVLISRDGHGPEDVRSLAALLPALRGVVDAVVLRWSGKDARDLFGAVAALTAVESRPPLLLRNRVDVALTAGLEGVQLSEDGFDPGPVRAAWPEALIGVSRHDREGILRRTAGADFALLSPVFETGTKPGARPLGLADFAAIATGAPCPVLALGGIDAGSAGALVREGAAGVAVRSAILSSADPAGSARRVRLALDSAAPAAPDH